MLLLYSLPLSANAQVEILGNYAAIQASKDGRLTSVGDDYYLDIRKKDHAVLYWCYNTFLEPKSRCSPEAFASRGETGSYILATFQVSWVYIGASRHESFRLAPIKAQQPRDNGDKGFVLDRPDSKTVKWSHAANSDHLIARYANQMLAPDFRNAAVIKQWLIDSEEMLKLAYKSAQADPVREEWLLPDILMPLTNGELIHRTVYDTGRFYTLYDGSVWQMMDTVNRQELLIYENVSGHKENRRFKLAFLIRRSLVGDEWLYDYTLASNNKAFMCKRLDALAGKYFEEYWKWNQGLGAATLGDSPTALYEFIRGLPEQAAKTCQ